MKDLETFSYKLKSGNRFGLTIVEAIKTFDCHKYAKPQQKERHLEAKIEKITIKF